MNIRLLIPLAKISALIIPALGSVYISYKSSNSGYKELVESVKELQDVVDAQAKEIAKLQGRQETWEKMRRSTIRAFNTAETEPIVIKPQFRSMPANLDVLAK